MYRTKQQKLRHNLAFNFACELKWAVNQVAVKPADIQTVPGYCWTAVQRFQIYCLGKCGVAILALCGGRHGGLSCLWETI